MKIEIWLNNLFFVIKKYKKKILDLFWSIIVICVDSCLPFTSVFRKHYHFGLFLAQFLRTQLFIIEIHLIKPEGSSTFTVL